MRTYGEADADVSALKNKTVGVLGYGAQGTAHALNLRDSGIDVLVAQRPGSPNHDRALADGFQPGSLADVAARSDLVIMGLPDESAAELYEEYIAGGLRSGCALGFLHGFNITFKFIEPPDNVDVVMISPKGPGSLVRSTYRETIGVPALMAVHQDATGRARDIALAWAAGIGATRAGVFETSFRTETCADLFGEQVVLCGGMSALMLAAYEMLTTAGYEPEVAYFECIHEMKQIADLIYEHGISHMREQISNTAEYGDLTRGPRLIDTRTRETMRILLAEIESGQFAREWMEENRSGLKCFKTLFELGAGHDSEPVGSRLRQHMPWLRAATNNE
ncbi:MAG: ketol-acid reductoisomerase [Phycisphaerales bacterium]|nr:MAG: ketol-acid reductoisomerase [Phycisphaerales bacterium]